MQTLETISKRYSARKYQNKPVPAGLLDTVLTAGCSAAVGNGNYQSVHLTVVQSSEMMSKLPTAYLYGAPVFILLSAPAEPAMNDINFANAGCILENMMLAATDQGLGSVYEWAPIAEISGNSTLCRELGIPDGFKPVSGLALGYPDGDGVQKELTMRISCNML